MLQQFTQQTGEIKRAVQEAIERMMFEQEMGNVTLGVLEIFFKEQSEKNPEDDCRCLSRFRTMPAKWSTC